MLITINQDSPQYVLRKSKTRRQSDDQLDRQQGKSKAGVREP